MKVVAASLLLLGLATGCARHTSTEPSASPSTAPATISNKADCQNAGGVWHSLTRTCELRR